MSSSRNIPQNASRNGLVRVCDDRHILRETDKAIQVRIGQTLYGEPITTFYPKSLVQILYKLGGWKKYDGNVNGKMRIPGYGVQKAYVRLADSTTPAT